MCNINACKNELYDINGVKNQRGCKRKNCEWFILSFI